MRKQIIDEINTLESFTEILLNLYGNYVMQKALEHAEPDVRTKLLEVTLTFFTSSLRK